MNMTLPVLQRRSQVSRGPGYKQLQHSVTSACTRFRENLPSRCFAKHRNRHKHRNSLNSWQWIFVRKGLDDFRRGCPPCQDLIMKDPQEGVLPLIYHRVSQPAPKMRQNKLPKEAAVFPRLSPAQRARKAFIEDIETLLARHPLALYLNLKEDTPVEVLEVLDPDRKLEDMWACCQDTRKRMKEPTKCLNKHSTEVFLRLPKKTPVSHSGQWVYEEKKPSETDLLCSPVLHENIRKEVGDFCSWAASLGSSPIDEEFILKQFDIDYENRPCSDVLHTMRLNQVPLELKSSVGLHKPQELDFSFKELDFKKKCQKPQNPCKPEWVKIRYGAWYLNTKLWKKLRANEPLTDSKILLKAEDENLKKKLQEKVDLFEELHGMVAFKDFILSRGYRTPSFLEKMCVRKEYEYKCNKTTVKQSKKLIEA